MNLSSRASRLPFGSACSLLIRSLLFAVLPALLQLPATAQEDPFEVARPAIRVYTDRDGLPQNSIEEMVMDRVGRLWVTTRDGLAIHDGSSWESMSLPGGSPSNWPRTIAISAEGAIWIGAEQGGVFRYADGSWRRFDRSSGLPSDRIRLLREIDFRGEKLLIAGTANGLAIREPREESFVALPQLDGREILSLLSSGDDLWVGTDQGLFRCDGRDCVSVNRDPRGTGEIAVTALAERGPALFAGTARGLFRVEESGWIPVGEEELGEVPVTDIVEVGQGNATTLWVSTEGRGIRILEGDSWRAMEVESGLPNNFVFDLLAWPSPADPVLIFGGTLSGLAAIDLDGWRAVSLGSTFPDRSIVSFLESGSGDAARYWIGTTHGLASFVDGEWKNVLPDDSVFALAEARAGEIYAGTREGLLRLSGGRWADAGQGLPDASVVAIAEEGSGDRSRLWVGTYGEGIWVSDGDLFRRGASLPDDRVEAILPASIDGRDVVLVGTNRGLVAIDEGEQQTWGTGEGLPSDVVRAIHIRKTSGGSRQLWVGTGRGVAWTGLDATFDWTVLDDGTDPALPSNTVYRIEEDSEGRIYLFTSRGILRLEMEGGRPESWRLFTTEDGLPSNEINFGATMVDTAGRVWAGTPMGAAIFDPERERDGPPAKLVLLEVQVDRKPVEIAEAFKLEADQRTFTADVRLIDLDGGEHARYRSRLENVESEPGPWTSSSRVELTGLAPGSYDLLIEAMDDEGRVYGPLGISFVVASPWWASSAAVSLYVILAIVLVWGLVQWRVRSLRRRTTQLERLVKSRTLDLERSNRELEAANKSLWAMTETDPLTGAKNRRWVSLHLESEAERIASSSRRGDDLLLILVDIDHFKAVNDRFGHTIGDAVLRHFRDVLIRTVRESDTLVRWGGEEFLVIARQTSREEAPLIARRIVEEVRDEPFETGGGSEIRLTCSVGISPFPFDQDERRLIPWQDVLGIADHCLYTVKNSGRDGWVGVFAGENEPSSDLLARLRESADRLVDQDVIRVESSFRRESLRWPPPESAE